MQLRAIGQSLDRQDVGAVGAQRQYGAGFDGFAIHMDHASAALGGIAPNVGSREPEVFAQELHQQGARIDIGFDVLAVHLHGNTGHNVSPLLARQMAAF